MSGKALVEQPELLPAAIEHRRDDPALLMFERLATDPNVDVSKLERLIEMQERILRNQAEAAFNDAFATMQRELPVIIEHGKTNNGTYAPLEDIVEAVRPIITKHGFALSHRTEWPEKGMVRIVGILSHQQGHARSSEFLGQADTSGSKNAIQGLGSTISYGRRYTTNDLLNIVTRGTDDDARRAARAPAPEGYDDWLSTLAAKADEGLPALQAMWKVANSDTDLKVFAQHLTKTEPETWNNLKAKAAKIKAVTK